MDNIPELFPKLTEDIIAMQPKLFACADLRSFVNWMRLLGVYGAKQNSVPYLARRIYKTYPQKSFDEDGNPVIKLDKIYAKNRINNILDGKHLITETEMAWFRMCLVQVFGDNLGKSVSDEEIGLGNATVLIRRLLSEAPALDWAGIDPLAALEAIAISAVEPLDITFNNFSGHFRMVEDEDGYDTNRPMF